MLYGNFDLIMLSFLVLAMISSVLVYLTAWIGIIILICHDSKNEQKFKTLFVYVYVDVSQRKIINFNFSSYTH